MLFTRAHILYTAKLPKDTRLAIFFQFTVLHNRYKTYSVLSCIGKWGKRSLIINYIKFTLYETAYSENLYDEIYFYLDLK